MSEYNLKEAVIKIRDKRMNFALFKGSKENQVLIGPKPATPKQIAGLEEECGEVKRIAKGLCFWEGSELVFATKNTPSPAWEAMLTKIFKAQQCAKFLPVVLQQLAADESDEVATEEAPGGTVPTPPVTPGVPGDPAAQWVALKGELVPQIKAAVAANPAAKEAITAQVSAGLAFEKAGNFAEAIAAWEKLRPLLAPPGSSAVPPPAPPPMPAVNAGQLQAALNKLAPEIKAAVVASPDRKTEIVKFVAKFQKNLQASEIGEAQASLEDLVALLKSLAPGETKPATGGTPLEIWTAAKDIADASINALRDTLSKSDDARQRKIANEGITGGGLNSLTGGRMVALMTALFECNAAPPTPQQKQKAVKAASELRTFLQADRVIALCDENPFNGPLNLRAVLVPALDEIEQRLAA